MAITKVTSGLISADAASVDLNIDAGTLYIDTTNNRVGIANTSPTVALDVTGAVTLSGTLTASSLIYPTSDGTSGQALVTDGSGNLSFSTIQGYTDSDVESYLDGGTSTPTFASAIVSGDLTVDTDTLYVDSTNNRVGIGTTSPDRAIKIHQDNAYVWIADAAGGNVGFIGGSGANDGLMRLYEGTGHTAKVEIHSNSDSYFNGGNVGIGTNSPAFQNANSGLHIVDPTAPGIRLQDSNAVNSDFEIYSPDGVNNLRIAKAGTDFMALDSSGVGIGTNSPSYKLDVNSGSTDEVARFQTTANARIKITSSNTANAIIDFGDSDSSTIGQIDYDNLDNSMRFVTNAGERMRITSAGNVGIGETSPETPLHVSASNTGYTSVTGQTVALFERNGDCHVTIRSNAANHGSIKFADDGNSRGEIRYRHGSGTDAMSIFTAGTERIRIDSSGNVGIGYTAPANPLSVSGVISSGNTTGVGVGGTPSDANFGELGPGYLNLARDDTASARQITFGKNGAVHSYLETTSSALNINTASGLDMNILSASGMTIGSTTSILVFKTNNTEKARIDASGRLGVGTTSGNAGITCSTDIRAAGASFANDANTITMSQESGGAFITARGPDTSTRGTISLSVNRSNGSAGIAAIRINSSGQVSINDTTDPDNSAEMLQVRGTNNAVAPIVLRNASGDQSAYRMIHYYKKEETSPIAITALDITGSAVTHSYLSDERLKDELGSADGLNLISELNPIKFRFKDGTGTGSQGFTAQGFKQAFDNIGSFPRGVTVPDNPDEYWHLDDKVLIPNLVKAIQELKEENDNLKARIEVIENG